MPIRLSVVGMCAVLAFGAQAAQAQRSFTVGLSGGGSLPASDLNETHKVGINTAAHVAIRGRESALGLRLEGFYNLFDNTAFACAGPCPDPGTFGSLPVRITGTNVNIVYDFAGTGVVPYVIGGVGAYNVKLEGGGSSSDFGINAGLGGKFRISTLGAFIEARLHTTRGDRQVQYVPITFGIEF